MGIMGYFKRNDFYHSWKKTTKREDVACTQCGERIPKGTFLITSKKQYVHIYYHDINCLIAAYGESAAHVIL